MARKCVTKLSKIVFYFVQQGVCVVFKVLDVVSQCGQSNGNVVLKVVGSMWYCSV